MQVKAPAIQSDNNKDWDFWYDVLRNSLEITVENLQYYQHFSDQHECKHRISRLVQRFVFQFAHVYICFWITFNYGRFVSILIYDCHAVIQLACILLIWRAKYFACLLQSKAVFIHICIDMHACTNVFVCTKEIRSRERETIQQSERLNNTLIYICIHMEGT
jgi:hypothetical protein